ncbi:carboxypeptidase M32 [Radicibacter daui]|uniref:carboxypeptidase M32 n=1 Tax=Radicibacter daui TaxID=3064829 RepID=UPI0040469320
MAAALAELEGRFKRISNINGALAVLGWDRSAVMPAGGAEARAGQVAALSVIAHEMVTAPDMDGLLSTAEAEPVNDRWRASNLREMRRVWVHANAVPGSLVEKLAHATSACEMAWRQARPAGDFAVVKPHLATLLELVRETAVAKAEALGTSLYDGLLDQYEPGMKSATIDALFDDLATFLPGFIGEVLDKQASAGPILPLEGNFPIARQEALGRRLMQAIGFDFNHGRLDVSAHPFCGGTPDDVRITTRYREDDFASAIMGVMHETGHAMYELGLPRDWRGLPVGEARSMAIHESQSLIVEMQAGRSAEFLSYAAPLFREAFGGNGPAWEAQNIRRLYTRVSRGFIRVEADEVTYPAHVILRFRLEKALIAGDLTLDDLPGAWNDGMKELLGVVPPGDTLGVLQDIHWYDGAFGYFPTYTLGAMTAAQLFDAASKADSDLKPGLARGDFGPLMRWLRSNIHEKACLLDSTALLTEATGKPLDAGIFKRHLTQRYLG